MDDSNGINYAKNDKGREPRSEVWALIIVDTSFSPANWWKEIVPNRKKETHVSIIGDVVHSGTIIHSGEFSSYRDMAKINSYEHIVQ